MHTESAGPAVPELVDLVVDVANVMGSRPDGWWRDRAAAAGRLLAPLARLQDAEVQGPWPGRLRVRRILAVVEGRARGVPGTAGLEMVRAADDGDAAVVQACSDLLQEGGNPLAVTADRGLRDRLPEGTAVAGPGWLRGLLDQVPREAGHPSDG